MDFLSPYVTEVCTDLSSRVRSVVHDIERERDRVKRREDASEISVRPRERCFTISSSDRRRSNTSEVLSAKISFLEKHCRGRFQSPFVTNRVGPSVR